MNKYLKAGICIVLLAAFFSAIILILSNLKSNNDGDNGTTVSMEETETQEAVSAVEDTTEDIKTEYEQENTTEDLAQDDNGEATTEDESVEDKVSEEETSEETIEDTLEETEEDISNTYETESSSEEGLSTSENAGSEQATTNEPITEMPTTVIPTTVIPTTVIPTTVIPTTITPTTAEPTTAVPTTIETSTEVPTTEAPYPIAVEAIVRSEKRYIGDVLTSSDFTVSVIMSDGSALTNPDGWNADPLELTSTENTITINYEGLRARILVKAEERKIIDPIVDPIIDPIYVFFGDSRFVGLKEIASPNDYFMALIGSGYYFMANKMEEIIANGNENCALIIGFGVNDGQYNWAKYIEAINDIADRYPGKVYFTTVVDVDEVMEQNYGYHKQNAMVEEFNSRLTSALNNKVYIIDTNAYLKQIGCEYLDGVHFTDNTSLDLYNYIKSVVEDTFNN